MQYHYNNNICIHCADENLTVYIVQHLYKMYSYPYAMQLPSEHISVYISRTSAFNNVRIRRSKEVKFRLSFEVILINV